MKSENVLKCNSFVTVVMVASDLYQLGIRSSIETLYDYLELHYIDYEILVVEDKPAIIEAESLTSIMKEIPSVRYVELSYEVDYEVAITVGLENSIGDFVVILNPSLEPLDVIAPMVKLSQKCSVDVVVGVADNQKKSIGYRLVRPFVNFILKEIGYKIPKNSSTLRCLSRTAVNSATKARNYHHQIFVRIAQCGATSCSYDFSIIDNRKREINLFNSINRTLNLLIFNSSKPLRWMTSLGCIGSLFALIFACYSFFTRLASDNVADGWSSIVILISFLFMLLFTILSFFGEYLSRLLNEQSQHEAYWITNERHSTVMVDISRNNVLEESDKITPR
ncbi:glycosyltransferase [Vibrio sp. 03-59-1]|uniref:glycosyltransferase n=1 Tax=Vibrio sp. 03-59-1 TaxID=2607607 RepID=UPI001493304B|nr:glycosyltransferase [Vibrio sp. 03-59-1]NOH84524.1 glycosyltransferase [Vibrio sp. 03-59-1]